MGGSCSWEITTNGVLTINPGTGADIQTDSNTPWVNYANQVTTIKTTGTVILPANSQKLFYGMTNLTDISGLANLDTSNVTSTHSMFYNCHNLTDLSPLSSWNTTNMTNLGYMFTGCNEITTLESLVSWRLPKAYHLQGMFQDCYKLTDIQATANWDLGDALTQTGWMFRDCHELADISSLASWKVTNIVQTAGMFQSCPKITTTAPLKDWKTPQLRDMKYMFCGTKDAQLTDLSGLADWDVSHVTDMSYVFMHQPKINEINSLSSWSTTSVVTMRGMFNGCSSLTDINALADWDLNSINPTNSTDVFDGCSSLELVGVPTADHNGAWLLNEYANATAPKNWTAYDWAPVNRNLTSSQVKAGYTNSNPTITDVRVWRLGVKYWGTCPWWIDEDGTLHINDVPGEGVGADVQLANSAQPTNEDAKQIPWWSVKDQVRRIVTGSTVVMPSKSCNLFQWMPNLTDISGLENWDASHVTNMSNMFRAGSATSDTSSSLKNIAALTDWDVSNVKSMDCMFWGNRALDDLGGLSRWSTKSLETTRWMFQGCARVMSLEPFKNWDVSKVTQTNCMFEGANGLTSLDGLENWDTSSLVNVAGMFSAYSNATSAKPSPYPESGKISDVSALADWDMSHVTSARAMFAGSQLGNLDDLKDWDLSSCGDFSAMFTDSPVLRDTSAIAGWKLDETVMSGNDAPTRYMFRDCPEIARAGVPAVGHGAVYVAPEYPNHNWTDEELPITPLKDSNGIYPYMQSNEEDREFVDDGGVFIPYQPVYIVTFDDNDATRPGALPDRQWAYVDPTGGQRGDVNLPVGYDGTRTGYHFAGWSTTPDASSGVISADLKTWRPSGGLSTGDPSKIVLYAVWEANMSTELPSTGSHGLVESMLGFMGVIGLLIATGRTRRPRHGAC